MPSPQNVDKQHEGRVASKAVDLSRPAETVGLDDQSIN